MKKVKGIRFEFSGNYHSDMVPDRWGRIRCDICGARNRSTGVNVVLDDFLICPACICTGPAAVAAEAKRIAGDKDRIAEIWDYAESDNDLEKDFFQSMSRGYRGMAMALRGVHSFEELPGGKIALGVAGEMRAPVGRKKGKAA